MVPEHFEGAVSVDRVPRHQDAFRLLDHRPPPEGALEALVFRETLQGDVDRALELGSVAVHDVGEDAALRRFPDVRGILGMQQCDHRASGFTDDLRDQLEGVLRAQPETDECYIRPLPLGGGSNFLDVDLASDHLVAEADHDLRKQLEPIAPLVRDQDAKMLRLTLGPSPRPRRWKRIETISDPRISAIVTETSSSTPAL